MNEQGPHECTDKSIRMHVHAKPARSVSSVKLSVRGYIVMAYTAMAYIVMAIPTLQRMSRQFSCPGASDILSQGIYS